MNWIRFRYIAFTLIWGSIAVALAYGLAPVGDPMYAEFAVLAGLILFFSFAMGRHSDREDETAGIISFDDDD